LAIINENFSTDKIDITISNNVNRAQLSIGFKSYSENIETILNNDTANEINSKLEMYEGKMKLISTDNCYYTILVVVV
jgi:hypothetical protein